MTDIGQLAIGGVSLAVIIGTMVQMLKYIPSDNEKLKKWLPWIAAGIGAVVGLFASNFVFPDLIAYFVVGAQIGFSASGGYDGITTFKKEEQG